MATPVADLQYVISLEERPMPLKDLSKKLKEFGLNVSYMSLWRYVNEDYRGLKLPVIQISGRIHSSVRAFEWFCQRKTLLKNASK